MAIIGKRLKEARIKAGLSQEQLGIRAAIEEASASARMNRYERGTRTPAISLLQQLGKVLDLPLTYFFAEEDEEAILLEAFHRMSEEDRKAVVAKIVAM